eukprot:gnl/MRDRNA2_/MRDRNA2_64290_c0_seq1.p1 gnl/MRDRNA2_/MRDRNA2_64290_c0~~gnl/MRDRNA2_/MRDRNA2_64290_c0_seq1.p1  ORF type:complete len:306 (+),score=22.30 gnl/MRDRNA2_/MRDRNA2_64290_c0_seq1:70-987(+)
MQFCIAALLACGFLAITGRGEVNCLPVLTGGVMPVCDDGTRPTPCCAYGACNFPFCTCKVSCRTMGPPSDCRSKITHEGWRCRRIYTNDINFIESVVEVNCSDVYNDQDTSYPVDVWYELPKARPIITGVGSDVGTEALQILHRWSLNKRWILDEGSYELPPGQEIRVRNGSLTVRHIRFRWGKGINPGKVWLVGCDHVPPDADGSQQTADDPWGKIVIHLLLIIFACGLCLCSTLVMKMIYKCCCRCKAFVLRQRGAEEHIEVPLLGVIDSANGREVALKSPSSPSAPSEQTTQLNLEEDAIDS